MINYLPFPVQLGSPSLAAKFVREALRIERPRNIALLKSSDGGFINVQQKIEVAPEDDFEFEMVVQVERDDPNYDSIVQGNASDDTPAFRLKKNKYVDGGAAWEHGSLQLEMKHTQTAYYADCAPEDRNPEFPTKFNRLKIVRTGKEMDYIVNGVKAIGTHIGAESWIPFTIHRINELATCRFLEFKFTKNGQKIIDHDLSAPHGTTIIPNLAQPLGVELYADNPFVVANAGTVTKLTSDSWSVQTSHGSPNNLAYGARILSFPVTPNESYLFKVEANEDVNLLAYNSAYQLISRGVNEVLFTTTEAFVRLYVSPRTTNAVIFKKSSIKKASYYAEFVNVTDDNKEQFTWNSERNAWVGLADYKALNMSVNQTNAWSGIITITGFVIGSKYLITIDADIASGDMHLVNFDSTDSLSFTASGKQIYAVTAKASTCYLQSKSTGFAGTINTLIVQSLLDMGAQ
ncbi:hypothetical protein [Pseudoalteromonas piratica]|uniref:Uncharacterized protein n=1 Tax=Pseudoalteromonas piratica TaxID=1348114 RepID=A0A0A7EGL8_9GAMM|nr:hypothetical protein [Pseudoalteromonas piratica]AIY65206.1 hypothetical protein OM33_08560 [Pseudoalteromonas piratica]